MKMRRLFLIILISILFFCGNKLQAQRYKAIAPSIATQPAVVVNADYSFDLGGSVNTITYTVKQKKKLSITIFNFLPSAHYTINETTQLKLSTPLENPSDGDSVRSKESDPCATFANSLKNAKSESEFGQIMANAKKANCTDIYKADSIASTYVYTVANRQNEITTITITNTDASPKKIWTIVLQPEESGQFVTLYGFTFIPYLFTKPHTYYAQAIAATPGSYLVTRGSGEGIADYAPTISFHYINKNSVNVSSSFTAGLGAGFNSSNSGISPVVLFGYSLLVHQNIGFNIGIASHLVNNLKGQYSNNQTITTNLASTDLTEKALGFNPFFSVVFRFGSIPFSVKKVNTPPATDATPSTSSGATH